MQIWGKKGNLSKEKTLSAKPVLNFDVRYNFSSELVKTRYNYPYLLSPFGICHSDLRVRPC